MPTKRTKRTRTPRQDWPPEMRAYLETGKWEDASVLPVFDSRFHTITVPEAWADLRAEIMRAWTKKKRNGRKPWAWGTERLSREQLLHR